MQADQKSVGQEDRLAQEDSEDSDEEEKEESQPLRRSSRVSKGKKNLSLAFGEGKATRFRIARPRTGGR